MTMCNFISGEITISGEPVEKAYPFIILCHFKLEDESEIKVETFHFADRYYFVNDLQLFPEVEQWLSKHFNKKCKLDFFERPKNANTALKRTLDILN